MYKPLDADTTTLQAGESGLQARRSYAACTAFASASTV